MKLAEALQERAAALSRVSHLQERVKENARLQEGDTPAEDPNMLLADIDSTLARLETLIAQINQTNTAIVLEGSMTMTQALAKRDVLKLQIAAWRAAASASLGITVMGKPVRQTRSEVRFVPQVKAGEAHARADALAKQLRELDSQIQRENWNNDLLIS